MVDKDLLELLACPWCLGALEELDDRLRCRRCKAQYAVQDGIPNLLVADATLACPQCGEPLEHEETHAACRRCERRFATTKRLDLSEFDNTPDASD